MWLIVLGCGVAPAGRETAAPETMATAKARFHWTGKTRPLLMAHYMPWYQSRKISGAWGWHWTMDHFNPVQAADGSWTGLASHGIPVIGPYDSSDEAVLEYQLALMKLSGIDGVIVDWYGSEIVWDYGSIHTSTVKLFKMVKKAGLKFVLCYEDQSVKHLLESNRFDAAGALRQGQKDMRTAQDAFFGDEAYLKLAGQPLLLTFGPQYFLNESDWRAVFSGLTVQPSLIMLDSHSVGGMTASYPWPPMWASQAGVLSRDTLNRYLNVFYQGAKGGKYLVGGAFPGFQDIYQQAGVGTSYGFLDARNGETFRETLQLALDQQADMIQLITWNDYGEGTMIEPTVETGTRYLELVQAARLVSSGGEFTYTAEDLGLALRLYQLRGEYARDAAVTARLDTAAGALFAGDLRTAAKILDRP